MNVYIAQPEASGPMFLLPQDALMVFVDPEDAQRAAEKQGEPGFAAKIDSGHVAQRLREKGHDRVVLVLKEDEMYSTSVDDFERIMERIMERIG